MDHIIHQNLWDTCGIRPKNLLIRDQIHVSVRGKTAPWGIGTMPLLEYHYHSSTTITTTTITIESTTPDLAGGRGRAAPASQEGVAAAAVRSV